MLEQLYAQLPGDRWGAVLSKPQTLVLNEIGVRASVQPVPRILDVGAFTGNFLRALPMGFEKSAIEPSASGQKELERHGIRVLGTFLEDMSPANSEHFDIVTMFDVFEHLSNPIEGMKLLYSLVKPGGSLIIATGNLDHWTFRLLRGQHWYLDPIQHLAVGGMRHFRWIATQMGAKIRLLMSSSHQSGEFYDKIREAAEVCYFYSRGTSISSKLVIRLFHTIQYFRRMSLRESPGYLMKLDDHIIAVFDKPFPDDQSQNSTSFATGKRLRRSSSR